MFFNSIKEINRLRKEENRFLSKGMSNFYLKETRNLSKIRPLDFEKKNDCSIRKNVL